MHTAPAPQPSGTARPRHATADDLRLAAGTLTTVSSDELRPGPTGNPHARRHLRLLAALTPNTPPHQLPRTLAAALRNPHLTPRLIADTLTDTPHETPVGALQQLARLTVAGHPPDRAAAIVEVPTAEAHRVSNFTQLPTIVRQQQTTAHTPPPT